MQQQPQQQRVFAPIRDRFETIEEVQRAIREAGLESSDLILAIDFTISNVDQGAQSFGGLCLHNTQTGSNPYMQTIDIIGRTMATFDDDNLIPVYGFGDKTTGARTCFPFMPHGAPCNGLEHALQRYQELAPIVQLDGPTCFAAVINVAIAHVCETGGYHILFIVADGQVTDGTSTGPTAQAIVRASNYALSIVVVGVGDGAIPLRNALRTHHAAGPWDAMTEFDDCLPQRRFDNFQFVCFNEVCSSQRHFEAHFALSALMEIPDQYALIRQHGLLGKCSPGALHAAHATMALTPTPQQVTIVPTTPPSSINSAPSAPPAAALML